MRRTYTKKPKNKKVLSKRAQVEQQALGQLRETRAKLMDEHGELLDALKKVIIKAQGQAKMPEAEPVEEVNVKSKNISTIEKFLDLKEDKASFDIAVKAMLSKHKE